MNNKLKIFYPVYFKTKFELINKPLWYKIILYWFCLSLIMYMLEMHSVYIYYKKFTWLYSLKKISELALKWAILIPLISVLVNKFSLFEKNWKKGLAVHFSAAFLVSFFISFTYELIHNKYLWAEGAVNIFFRIKPEMFYTTISSYNIIVYLLTAFVISAIKHFHNTNNAIIEASQLRIQLSQAQLHALKVRLNPHFLFNTLHSVSALMSNDTASARVMISKLKNLLSLLFDFNNVSMVTLKEEMKILELYLEIEQIRFQDRLKVVTKIEEETLNAYIPHLILQPLVENAIKHGLAPYSSAGKLEIHSSKIDHLLKIKIIDDGIGPNSAIFNSNGMGIANTQLRLKTIYKDNYEMKFESNNYGGLTVILLIPFHLHNIFETSL